MSERVKRWKREWEEEQKARKTEGRNPHPGHNWEDMPDVEKSIKGYLGNNGLMLSDGAMFKVCSQIANMKPHIELVKTARSKGDCKRKKHGPNVSIENELEALQKALNVQPITVREIDRALKEVAAKNQREYEERCARGEESNILKRPLSKEEKRAWSEATKHSLRYLTEAVEHAKNNIPLELPRPADRSLVASALLLTYKNYIYEENREIANFDPKRGGCLAGFVSTGLKHIFPNGGGISRDTLEPIIAKMKATGRL